jgi:hypothetical protein
MCLFSWRALKSALLAVGVLSSICTNPMRGAAQTPSWLPTSSTGDTPYGSSTQPYGMLHYNGRNYKIEYFATNTTSGVTSTIAAPLVNLTSSSGYWGGWSGSINAYTSVFSDTFARGFNYYYVDNGARAFATDPAYHGPISTDAGLASQTLRKITFSMDVTPGGSTGSLQAEADYPWILYKVTCLNPPNGNQVNINIASVQGAQAFIGYNPPPSYMMINQNFSAHAEVTTAGGVQATYDYQFVYGTDTYPTFTATSATPWFGQSGAPLARTYDQNNSITLAPQTNGTAVGYLAVAIHPFLTMYTNGYSGTLSVVSDWEIVPFQVTLGP